MPLHKDFISDAVKNAISKSDYPFTPDLEKAVTDAIYNVIRSRDFERYIVEIVRANIK